MARTIFGIFNNVIQLKKEFAVKHGLVFEAVIPVDELKFIADTYNVSANCIYLAYKLWKQSTFSPKMIHEVASKAAKLSVKDKVFLYNSLVPVADMAFENLPHNWDVCRGKMSTSVLKDSMELGVFDIADDYFFHDKDFGFLSFNEIRNVELAGAIEMWLYEQIQGGKRGTN